MKTIIDKKINRLKNTISNPSALKDEFLGIFKQIGNAIIFVWETNRFLTVISFVLLFFQATLPLLSLYIMKLVIDAITLAIKGGSDITFSRIAFLIGLEGLVALFIAISGVFSGWIREILSENVSLRMHGVILAKSVEVDLEYYEDPQYFDAMHRSQKEATFRTNKVFNDFLMFIQNFISLMTMAGVLIFLHWMIALILLITALPGIFVRIRYASVMYEWQRKVTPVERKTFYFHWVLTGDVFAKEVRLFGLGDYFIDRFTNLRLRLKDERQKLIAERSFSEAITQSASTVAIFSSYAFIAYNTFSGNISMGELILYYQAFQRGQAYLNQLLTSLASLYEDNLYLSNLFEFLLLDKRVKEPELPVPVPCPFKKGIIFENVSFKYPNTNTDALALENINLVIHPGETIALVGENGSGKTTLIKLLCRLYDLTSGSIRIDGINIKEFKIEDFRREFTVVFQDFVRYNMKVYENINIGCLSDEVNIEKIREAAIKSGADPVITNLKEGYETMLGKWFEGGEELSLGEWQKVALARAFLRDAQVIIMDEPSSAMDPRAEYEIFNKFKAMFDGKTKILISHRLSTVKMADTIYVMDRGKIAEHGSHDELMKKGDKYAVLFNMQAGAYQ
jgi:ATP-binding cassette subfamily B protein